MAATKNFRQTEICAFPELAVRPAPVVIAEEICDEYDPAAEARARFFGTRNSLTIPLRERDRLRLEWLAKKKA